jgi:hypothetical protein
MVTQANLGLDCSIFSYAKMNRLCYIKPARIVGFHFTHTLHVDLGQTHKMLDLVFSIASIYSNRSVSDVSSHDLAVLSHGVFPPINQASTLRITLPNPRREGSTMQLIVRYCIPLTKKKKEIC